MNILKEIKKLNLPLGSYVVVGSGTLDVLGIRSAKDVDMVVTPGQFNELRKTGMWKEEKKFGKIFLKKDVFEIGGELSWDKYNTTFEDLINNALVIKDIPFMNLDELIKFKIALGREKDFEDIELIKNYQNKI